VTAALSIARERPLVRVVIPCFNYGHHLEGCLDSVLSQEGVDVEVLIIDDCSTDDSASVARALAAKHEHVQVREHLRNAGLIATANEGLEWAQRADCLLLLSADDELLPGALLRAAVVLAEHRSVGMVYGRVLRTRTMQAPRRSRRADRWRSTKVWRGPAWIRLRCRSGHNCISSPEAVVRGSVQRAVGGYDPACTHTSDLNMWLRIAAVSDIAHIRGVPQAMYRVHDASMWRSQDGPLVELYERRAAFDRFFATCEPSLADVASLRATVGRTLARQALWKASRAMDRAGDPELVDAFTQFALDVCPRAAHLREWHGLRLRRRIGAGRSLAFPPLLVSSAVHRARTQAGWMRLRFRGL
jgi:hypothetical protein